MQQARFAGTFVVKQASRLPGSRPQGLVGQVPRGLGAQAPKGLGVGPLQNFKNYIFFENFWSEPGEAVGVG